MTWFDQLTRPPAPPKWTGPAHVHLKLSAGEDEGSPKLEPRVNGGRKFCPACERDLPATRAFFYSHTVRGKVYLHTRCKQCMCAEQAERDSLRRGPRR